MTNTTLNFKKSIIILGIPLLLIAALALLAKSPLLLSHSDSLSFGITFDLLITVPFVYFLLIRKTSIPNTTVVPFIIVGMLVGINILPGQNQYYLELFRTWGLPIVELSVVSFVIYKVVKAIKGYKTNKNSSIDFYTTLKNTCYEVLPKGLVIPVVTEIAVFYYGFIYWRKRSLRENEFSYHKESGTIGLLAAILFIVCIETFVVHSMLLKWSETAAWILTALSIYSGFQFFGFLKSILKRPISIEEDKLYLRCGIMKETTIDLAKIDKVEISSKDLEFNSQNRRFSFLGELESHNVIIYLKEEHSMSGLYGIKRKYTNLALHVDEKIRFADEINKALQK